MRRRVRVLRAPTEDSPSPPNKVTLIFLMPSMDLYWNFVTAPQRVSADMTSGIPNQNPEAYEGFVEEFLLLTALCRGVVSLVLLTKIRSARGCGTMAARRRAGGWCGGRARRVRIILNNAALARDRSSVACAVPAGAVGPRAAGVGGPAVLGGGQSGQEPYLRAKIHKQDQRRGFSPARGCFRTRGSCGSSCRSSTPNVSESAWRPAKQRGVRAWRPPRTAASARKHRGFRPRPDAAFVQMRSIWR